MTKHPQRGMDAPLSWSDVAFLVAAIVLAGVLVGVFYDYFETLLGAGLVLAGVVAFFFPVGAFVYSLFRSPESKLMAARKSFQPVWERHRSEQLRIIYDVVYTPEARSALGYGLTTRLESSLLDKVIELPECDGAVLELFSWRVTVNKRVGQPPREGRWELTIVKVEDSKERPEA